MFSFFRKIVNIVDAKIRYRNLVDFPYSAVIGKNSKFEGGSKLYPHASFKGNLGFGSYVGNRSCISGFVGRYTSIGIDVKVIQGTHPYTTPFATTCPIFYSLRKQCGLTYTNIQRFDEMLSLDSCNDFSIRVGNDCWIGERAMIIGGAEIGDGAVVLAGAVVTKNVPPYAIVGGVPAKILKYRFSKETIDFLLEFKWWDRNSIWLKENVDLMNDIEKLKKFK
ncbi:hypothetical protein CWO01_14855 [Vibrio splendidus]|uniref:CatB-related O-acetyltransferase n=1 Tax=Vibrio splendidus TaxID=29497 RepID=UPI000D3AED69|nr:CatB-related O-acetyltransferase [Vibrio splendidus]PTP60927.1 hypothetical protein CWO01_14855 [Vibrio splendidus]